MNAGLEEIEVRSYEDLLGMIELGNRNRTTHATEANDVSSRSHAICQVTSTVDLFVYVCVCLLACLFVCMFINLWKYIHIYLCR